MKSIRGGLWRIVLGLPLCWAAPGFGRAEEAVGNDGAVEAPAARPRSWAILPAGVVNPENGVGAGLKFIDRDFRGTGLDLDFLVFGTTKGQFQLKYELRHRHAWGSDWEGRTEAESYYYPETWFGGGNHPREDDKHIYTPLGWRNSVQLGHPLGAGFLIFGTHDLRFTHMDGIAAAAGGPPDPSVLPPQLAGYRGGWESLAGLSLELDTRDDEKLPSRGWHAGQSAALSPFPTEYRYASLRTWLAWYAMPHPDWESAVKVQQESVLGHAPFYAYPYLGDKRLMRGVPEKRLRDRSAQAAQAELRWGFRLALPLIARFLGDTWQLAAFGGAGRVGKDAVDAWEETLHWSGGAGGRLIVGRRLGALRGDLAFSRFGYGLYVDFNQAF